MGKIRNSNIEILRILSMFMIIALHYMNSGNVLISVSFGSANYNFTWLIESFCYVAVNCYILITGYFLCKTEDIKKKKIFNIVVEVIFYSIVIYVLLCAAGFEKFSIKQFILMYQFPVSRGTYWFVTDYIVLLLCVPYINKFINSLTQKDHKKVIIIFGVIFSLIPSIMFFSLDRVGVFSGYSLIWFIYLYIVASYIRFYNVNIKKGYLLLIYMITGFLPFALKFMQNMVIQKEYWNLYAYSSVTVLFGSVCLFMIFINMKPIYNKFINLISSTTFGIYLIHTHYSLSNKILWTKLFDVESYCHKPLYIFIIHFILTVIFIFICCSIIEILRQQLFNVIKNIIKRLDRK